MVQRALITAAASGIGLATAQLAIREGYEVVISDIDVGAGETAAKEGGFQFIPCDLSKEGDIINLVNLAGTVDLLVNNGGISGPTAPVQEVTLPDWEHVMNVNLTAQYIACREMVPKMTLKGGGCIVNLSSVAGKIGYPNRAPYAASKWGVLGFTSALAREVGRDNIRVNAVLPGAVRGKRIEQVVTKFAQSQNMGFDDALDIYLSHHATHRFVEASEVAGTILFLASDAAKSMTAQFISVDGGYQ